MDVSEKLAIDGEVEEEPVYFSIELKYIKNFALKSFSNTEKLIFERRCFIKVGDLLLVGHDTFFELVRLENNQDIERLQYSKFQLIGKLIYIECTL